MFYTTKWNYKLGGYNNDEHWGATPSSSVHRVQHLLPSRERWVASYWDNFDVCHMIVLPFIWTITKLTLHYMSLACFFILSTERILQNLGVVPDLKIGEIFTTLDTNYHGPDLPARYEGVILPADWYVPGKGRRKKRQHRASHRKIRWVQPLVKPETRPFTEISFLTLDINQISFIATQLYWSIQECLGCVA